MTFHFENGGVILIFEEKEAVARGLLQNPELFSQILTHIQHLLFQILESAHKITIKEELLNPMKITNYMKS